MGREWSRFAGQGHLQADLDAEKSPEYRLRIRAKGYKPFESRVFRSDEGQVEYDVELTRSDAPQGVVVSGVVRRPDGKPLEGAEVASDVSPRWSRPLADRPHRGRQNPTEPGSGDREDRCSGSVLLHARARPCRSVLRRGRRPPRLLRRGQPRRLRGRSIHHGEAVGPHRGRGPGRPQAGIRGGDPLLRRSPGQSDVPYISDSGKTTADAEGRFVLDRVVPGDVRVARAFGEGSNLSAWSNGTLVEVRPGEAVRAEVGGKGRPVIARIVAPEGFDPKADYTLYSEFEIESDRPNIPYPKEVLAKRDGSLVTWGKQWWASAQGHEYRRNWFRLGQAKLQPDGTIRAQDVPPGEYRLRLTYAPIRFTAAGAPTGRIAFATKQFTIPEISGGRSDEAFDLGVLRPKPKQTLKVGQAAATVRGRVARRPSDQAGRTSGASTS